MDGPAQGQNGKSMADWIAAISAAIAALIAVLSLVASIKAANAAEQSVIASREIAKRQNVQSFYSAWQGARQLVSSRFDDDDYVFEIVNMGNLLGLTATFWKFEIIDRAIIAGEFWGAFDSIYITFASRDTKIKSVGKSGTEFLTKDIKLAHLEMGKMYEKMQSKIGGADDPG
jgi:hypothetical protein